ncbi:MAG: hypothetical protein KBD43_16080 [Saprospiraceae bacterium]|nr:hypothetical protein [Saprospiraceae bacterium]
MKVNFVNLTKTILVITGVLLLSADFSKAETTDTVELSVVSIQTIKADATPNNTFENGWKWILDVTLPENETYLQLKFEDWIDGANTIPVANNVRYYSSQALLSKTPTDAVVISSNSFGAIMKIDPDISNDLDTNIIGRQIQVVVEMKIPSSSPNGNYSSNYYVQSEPEPSITIEQPNGEGIYNYFHYEPILWSSTFFKPTDTVKIELWDTRSDCPLEDPTCKRGRGVIANNAFNSGQFAWQIKLDSDSNFYGSTTEKVYKIRITINNSDGISMTVFTEPFAILQKAPLIQGFSPETIKSGEKLSVFGEGFWQEKNTVSWNCPLLSWVASSTDLTSDNGSMIEFTFPKYEPSNDLVLPFEAHCFISVQNQNGDSSNVVLNSLLNFLIEKPALDTSDLDSK